MKSLSPIALLSATPAVSYDDAGCVVVKIPGLPPTLPTYALANLPECCRPPLKRPDRLDEAQVTFRKVPPLAYFCVVRYLETLAQCEKDAILIPMGDSVPYIGPSTPSDTDLLQLLIPHMHRPSKAVRWSYVDPRLWLALIRRYQPESLPATFFQYSLPLADPFLPYMQFLEPADHFTLITVLDLKGKGELNDDTILSLKCLHQLAVLECGSTRVTTAGIKRLAETLRTDDDEGSLDRGLWKIRTLGLRGCKVDETAVESLRSFPLLCVIDVRDTLCKRAPSIVGWESIMYLPADEHTDTYHPAPASARIPHLVTIARLHHRKLFPSSLPPFTVHVDKLYHPSAPKKQLEYGRGIGATPQAFPEQNGFFMIDGKGNVGSGSTETMEKKMKAREKSLNSKYIDRDEDGMNGWGHEDWVKPLRQLFGQLSSSPATKVVDTETEEVRRQIELEDLRMQVYSEHQAQLQRTEAETNARRNRDKVEWARDPSALSHRDRLNRELVLIRIPPDYGDLDVTIKRLRRLAAIKEGQKRVRAKEEKPAAMVVDKKRKVAAANSMWSDIASSADADKPKEPKRSVIGAGSSANAQTKSRNPFAKGPSTNVKKVVRG